MPEISRFYGIVIQMFYNEHLPPHFHASYSDFKLQVDIRNLSVIKGTMPRKGLNLVLDWAELHQDELIELWTLAQNDQPLPKIEPLL